jgi:16S rRNA processing protein RimM
MSEGYFATIARIRRPQGRRGEVAVEVLTDFPERFQAGSHAWLWMSGQERRGVELQDAWPHKGGMILKFAGVDSISDAEKLSGWQVQVPARDRVALQGSAVYVSDLVGCKVLEHGEELGTVEAVDDRTGAPVLMVKTPQGELLIPFATEICKAIDTVRGVVEVELPEGLRELNEGQQKMQPPINADERR